MLFNKYINEVLFVCLLFSYNKNVYIKRQFTNIINIPFRYYM